MKLVWQKSGDFIVCDPVDHLLVEFWLDKQQGQTWSTTTVMPQDLLISELNHLIKNVSFHLDKVKIKLIDMPITGTSQSQLNTLHRNWVLLHQNHPNISALFDPATDHQFKINMDRINKVLHQVEESFKLVLTSDDYFIERSTNISNIFGHANIKFPYENLGRSTYNKWKNFDSSVNTSDTNNFDELPNSLVINLDRTYVNQPPLEYIKWCENLNVVPQPNELLLANMKDLEHNLSVYRELFMKNFTFANNNVIFTQ